MKNFIRGFFLRWLPTLDSIISIRLPKDQNRRPCVGFVRLDRIGDFLLWLPAAKELTTHVRRQGRSSYLVAHQAWAALALQTGYWDEVIPLDPLRAEWDLPYRWRHFRRVAKNNTETLFHATFSREFLVADALCRVIPATNKIAHEGNARNSTQQNHARSAAWYTRLIPPPIARRELHELELNDHYCRGAGVSTSTSALCLVEPPETRPSDISLPERFVVLALGSTSPQKIWPEDYVYEVVSRTAKTHNMRSVIVGGKAEQAMSKRLAARLNNAVDLTGQLALSELIYVIRKSSLVLASDSAAGHIGAAVNVPTVVILGGGELGRFFPYPPGLAPHLRVAYSNPACAGCAWACGHPEFAGRTFPCVSDISPDNVLMLIDELIGG